MAAPEIDVEQEDTELDMGPALFVGEDRVAVKIGQTITHRGKDHWATSVVDLRAQEGETLPELAERVIDASFKVNFGVAEDFREMKEAEYQQALAERQQREAAAAAAQSTTRGPGRTR